MSRESGSCSNHGVTVRLSAAFCVLPWELVGDITNST